MNVVSPSEYLDKIKTRWKPQWKAVFLAALIAGIIIHLPVMLSDIPNHDGLDSMYFDQNMITSGRWFLMIACGFSSFYNIPWLIGILGIFYLACTGVILVELLEIKDKVMAALVGMLLVSFPALASTFAYVFTLDGYMMGMFLTVLGVFLTKKYPKGFVAGGVALAFGMGTYQAYLPFAIVLSVYCILVLFAEEPGQREKRGKSVLSFFGMGVIGVGFYYVILRILLVLERKELDTYQGISGMGQVALRDIPEMILNLYRDFWTFTVKSRIVFNNFFSGAAFLAIFCLCAFVVIRLAAAKKWWKKPGFFIIIILTVILLPVGMNVILIVSPGVNYHLLMRYQWILLPILASAFVCRFAKNKAAFWGIAVSAFVLFFCYAVTDNIAYSNLNKKYEKTYAYCLRLLDRIEQTEGYYQGIPVALVGGVGDEQFPETDITNAVTGSMIGMNGDYLLYTSPNYEKFMKYYLGATLNFVPVEKMGEIYYMEEYVEMESFPGKTSIRIIDGILCVKTENTERN